MVKTSELYGKLSEIARELSLEMTRSDSLYDIEFVNAYTSVLQARSDLLKAFSDDDNVLFTEDF